MTKESERLKKWMSEIIESQLNKAKTSEDKKLLSGIVGVEIAKNRMSLAFGLSLYQIERRLRGITQITKPRKPKKVRV